MKLKTIAALLITGLLSSACILQGVTAGAVLGFMATNAAPAAEAVISVKSAVDHYKESKNIKEKIKVLADVFCYIRQHYPNQMEYLRGKLKEAQVPAKIVTKAQELADKKCGSTSDPTGASDAD